MSRKQLLPFFSSLQMTIVPLSSGQATLINYALHIKIGRITSGSNTFSFSIEHESCFTSFLLLPSSQCLCFDGLIIHFCSKEHKLSFLSFPLPLKKKENNYTETVPHHKKIEMYVLHVMELVESTKRENYCKPHAAQEEISLSQSYSKNTCNTEHHFQKMRGNTPITSFPFFLNPSLKLLCKTSGK